MPEDFLQPLPHRPEDEPDWEPLFVALAVASQLAAAELPLGDASAP